MLFDLAHVPVLAIAAVLAGSALAIGVAGTRLAGYADELADRTGMGEIIAGAVFVGGSTSLPGIITSVVTAAQGYPALSVGNAVGGLTVQTAFLAVADLAYRKANLEHAAASATGLAQGTLLVSLLTLPLLATSTPEVTVLGVHPVSLVLVIGYGLGLRLLASVHDTPMWSPVRTRQTHDEAAQAEATGVDRRTTSALWWWFALSAAITAAAGFVVSQSAEALVEQTHLSESAVGTLFAAVSTSLPELVTAVAAVRRGALNLAVGDVIGGNSFDLLFLAAADVSYRAGSIYHAFTPENVFVAVLAILMTGVLLLGMLLRERHGIAGIGFESALILLLYAGSVVVLLA